MESIRDSSTPPFSGVAPMSSDTKHRVFVTRNIPDAGLEIVQAACDTEIWTEPLPPSREVLLESTLPRPLAEASASDTRPTY